MRKPFRLAIVAAVAVATLALSACTGTLTAPTTSTPTGETVAGDLEPFYGQVLQWENCGDGMQCGTATAPLDWNDPAAGEIDLAVVRHPATGDRQGSLLVNPGGPGGSGYDFVLNSVDFATDAELQAGFDIVGFDPRGVGRSSAVTCYEPAQMDEYLYGLADNERGSAT